MTQPAGFGKPKQTAKKPPSPGAKRRAEEVKQYEEMKQSGLPEYEIFVRIEGKNQWLPIGSIAVRRSDEINKAIFANEEALLNGAYHRLPMLKKNRDSITLEYGHRLKEFKDDPVELAVRPAPSVLNPLTNAVAKLGDTISGIFQRSSK
jgi:Family of unknown function (DUF6523)